MEQFNLDCAEIIDIFKNNLNITPSVKSIEHTFFNERYVSTINFKPYYQRNYVWDNEKATYFIESILLGTEIPPIVLFNNGDTKEVIDGRQRYETIKRFIDDDFTLSSKGLKILAYLKDKKYSQLSDELKTSFQDIKIRILQFAVVNEPQLTPNQKETVKKEIFRRYNSGISPLTSNDINRPEFINDNLTNVFKEKLNNDDSFLEKITVLFVPKSKRLSKKRDKINSILTRIRALLTLPYIPIYSYAAANSKKETITISYYKHVASIEGQMTNLTLFENIINKLRFIQDELKKINVAIADNILLYDVLFWALFLVEKNNLMDIDLINLQELIVVIKNNDNESEIIWDGIDEDSRDLNTIFEQTGSHYYRSVVNRYLFISNYFSEKYKLEMSPFLKNSTNFKETISNPEIKEFREFKLSKTDPSSASIVDVLKGINNSRFLIRPDYQRSEVINKQKASYLLESILLGIQIPPLFIYKRENSVSEVIDGQQRLLSIIGFLGETYKDENGETTFSNNHKFKLTKLRILTELNGFDIDKLAEKYPNQVDKIMTFDMSIVTINESDNKNFSPIDLFLRLNSKPFPIKPNTFEMWNSYIDKTFIEKTKEIADQYSESLFKTSDKRMKNEELVITLAYLDYKYKKEQIKPSNIINIYIRSKKINARIDNKQKITSLFDSELKKDTKFIKNIESVNDFIEKLMILSGTDFSGFNDLIFHTKKQGQSRTNQNFYFLWVILNGVSVNTVKSKKTLISDNIKKLFSEFKNPPEDLVIESFIDRLENIEN